MGQKYLICLLLLVATFMAFWQVKNYDFVNFDDDEYVSQNQHVQKGLTKESVYWAFTSDYAAVWMPLTWLSFMLDFELYGLNPGGFHLTNVLLHLANTLLLFLVLKRMTKSVWRSGFVAALFGLHPLHVESVAWITERKDVLSTLFWMLTMWAYIGFVERPGLTRYLLTGFTFAFGLMCKPMLVTLPFVLLLLDYWPLQRLKFGDRSALPLIQEKTVLFALSAVSCVVTIMVQRSGEALRSFDDFPLTVSIPNALVSYVRYIGKTIWPQNLAVFYPHPGFSLPTWQAAGAGLLLVCLSIAVIRWARRHPYLVVGWLWYLGTLVPVIGLVQTGNHGMADRFTYVPLIGLFMMIGWGFPEILGKYRFRTAVLTLLAVTALSASMMATWKQSRHWRNSITLFEHTINVSGDNGLAHNNLGMALARQQRLDEAMVHFLAALKINQKDVHVYNNLANTLAARGRFDQAIARYSEALRIRPDHASTHNNLAVTLEHLGRFEDAIGHYSEAVRLNPDFVEAHCNLGVVLMKIGKVQAAIDQHVTALELDPNYGKAHNNLGNAFAKIGKLDDAIAHYSRALEIRAHYPEAHNNLGVALARQGRLDEAVVQFEKALKLKPDYAQARANLSLALQSVGKGAEVPSLRSTP